MSRKLRIVSLLTNLCIGGDSNRLLAFARALDRSRFEHTVLVIADPSDHTHQALGALLPLFQAHGVAVESLNEPPRADQAGSGPAALRAWREAAALLRIVARLRRYFIQHPTDIIDARLNYAVMFGAVAGRLAGVPVIVATEYGPGFWRGPVLNLAGQLSYALTDALVTDSQAKIDEHRRWLWWQRLQTRVIDNGIYRPQAQRSRSEMRAWLKLPDKPGLKVIGQVSRLMPSKGQWVLVDAAQRVAAADPDVVFVICGYAHQPAYIDELRARAAGLGIGERVFIISYPGPVADVWAAIDIHVHASLLDSAPIAIHESLSLGLPSVVTRVGGIPGLVQEDVTSLVVAPGDPQALATALLRVLHEPGLAERLGAAARQRHERLYQPARMARETEALFVELFNSKARRGWVPLAES
jgi:glycosyltransferase involved in cell wall biosynthesis